MRRFPRDLGRAGSSRDARGSASSHAAGRSASRRERKAGEKRDEPAPVGAHQQDHDERVDHHVPLAIFGDIAVEDLDRRRRDQRAREAAEPADHHHDDEFRHLAEIGDLRGEHHDVMRIDRAGEPGESARYREDHRLDARRVDAEALGAQLVVADGAHEGAETRAQQGVHRQHADEGQHDEDDVEAARREPLRKRRHREAELAARDRVGGGEQDVHRLGEGPGRDGEVDRTHPQHEPAEPEAEKSRGRDPAQDAGPRRQAVIRGRRARRRKRRSPRRPAGRARTGR